MISGENDLATVFPQLAAQWDAEKNGSLTPGAVSPNSNRRVWWKCEKGHAYCAVIAYRAQSNSGCPYCTNRKVLAGFNDLATLDPAVAKEWHPTLNGALTPDMVTAGSKKKVWWECKAGHAWKAVIYSRASSQKCGCAVCADLMRRLIRDDYKATDKSGSLTVSASDSAGSYEYCVLCGKKPKFSATRRLTNVNAM